MPVALGLCAAVFYGAADFCGGLATKRTSIFSVAVVSQGVGFAIILILVPFFPATARATDFGWGMLAGVCGGLGLALLYYALSIGKMGVVSPITAVLAAVLPVIIGTVRGERLSWYQAIGIAIALVAVVLISLSVDRAGHREFSTAGIKEAIASGIVLGGFYTFLALAGKHAGLYPLVAARVGSVGFLILVALLLRRSIRPSGGTLPLIALAGAIDMVANTLYLLATYAGYLSVAAVLTSLYPASTVLLARFVLNERLQALQKIGVVLALLGVVLIAK